MSYAPRIRTVKSPGGTFRDPFDLLEELLTPPPMLSDNEIALILAKAPPEDLIINMSKTADGYVPDSVIYTPSSRRR